MVQAVWFDAGPAQPGRLLLIVHHLAVDGVSWRILLPDLRPPGRRRCRARARPSLPPHRHLVPALGAAAGRRARRPTGGRAAALDRRGDAPEPPLGARRAGSRRRHVTGSARGLTLTLPRRSPSGC